MCVMLLNRTIFEGRHEKKDRYGFRMMCETRKNIEWSTHVV